ncbi:nucleoside diphosphate kinase regulator [Nitrospirales bacterium NOB]|nr:nucleoside diphosphate kinase regulator [Nitrospirales bacterium NOB]
MTVRDIYITEYDLTRLQGLVAARIHAKSRDRELLEQLQQELDRAHVVTPQEIPHDIVTMNSRVRITDMESGQEQTYTLVFPAESNMAEGKVSVLAPIGTALLDCRAGDTVDWPVPVGLKTVRIREVLYQPEATGRYDL